MYKNFDDWNKCKKTIHFSERNVFFHEREVWICSIGLNVGDEQDGKNERFIRPVVVLKKFNKNIFCSVPMTSIPKKGKYYFSFKFDNRISTVILSQIRTFSHKRLIRKIGMMSKNDFYLLQKNIRNLLNLDQINKNGSLSGASEAEAI